jgi:PAS domain S-box-containing protein
MLVDLLKEIEALAIASTAEPAAALLGLLRNAIDARRIEPQAFDALRPAAGDADRLLAALDVVKKLIFDAIEQRALAVPAAEARLLADWFAGVTGWALRAENRRFATMLDALPDQIFLKDAGGRFVYVNRAMAETLRAMTGLSRQELIGLDSAEETFPESFKRYIDDLHRRVLAGEFITEEFRLPESLGAMWREHHLAPVVDGEGRVQGIAVASRDIQARKMAEANAARARDELAQAVAFRESVMAVLGHDLRNPLSSVLSLADLLQEREVSGRVRQGLAQIKRAGERMNEMIGAILDVSQFRLRGGLELRYEVVELDAVARAVIDELRVAHRQRTIELATVGTAVGRWDRGRIAQVLSNLVANALTHGSPDTPVRVALSATDADIVAAVSNDGPTIPEDQIERLFEPFRRGPTGTSSPAGGLGLGLFIVREVVRAHGGRVAVRSGRGTTTFTVHLPREADAASPTCAAPPIEP